MNLSLRNLELVNVIVREGSLTRAAEKLFLSQPALSHQLKKLEEQIGLKAFNRVGKKLILTEAGQVLYEASERILTSFRKLNAQLEDVKSGTKKKIRLSTECYTCYHWLPQTIHEFRKNNNDINIQIVIEATKAPLQYLLEGKIDLAIVSSVVNHPSIHFQPLIEDEMVIIMSKENKLSHRKSISVSDLKKQNLILYDLPKEKNYVITHILNNNLEAANSIQKVQLTEAIIQLVKANLGISVMAKWSVSSLLEDEKIKIIPFKSNKGKRNWYIASLSEISQSEKMFIRQIQNIFNE